MMSVGAETYVGRHLLVLNENMEAEVDMSSAFPPAVTVLSGALAAVVLIIAVVLCVCKETKVV